MRLKRNALHPKHWRRGGLFKPGDRVVDVYYGSNGRDYYETFGLTGVVVRLTGDEYDDYVVAFDKYDRRKRLETELRSEKDVIKERRNAPFKVGDRVIYTDRYGSDHAAKVAAPPTLDQGGIWRIPIEWKYFAGEITSFPVEESVLRRDDV